MSGISNAERQARIHTEALADFDKIQSAMRDERLQCLQDRRFYSVAGAQWEGWQHASGALITPVSPRTIAASGR